jgi:hypothetical protein
MVALTIHCCLISALWIQSLSQHENQGEERCPKWTKVTPHLMLKPREVGRGEWTLPNLHYNNQGHRFTSSQVLFGRHMNLVFVCFLINLDLNNPPQWTHNSSLSHRKTNICPPPNTVVGTCGSQVSCLLNQ